MSWFPVDDAFHSHPKARKAGLEAVGLWTLAGSYSMAYLTDGFVPEWWVKEKPRGMALARRLVAADLWISEEKGGEQGFQFHDWKPECTKEVILENRRKNRLRKQKQRQSQEESRVTDGVTDGVSPASCLVPTQPNPTQPINPLVNSSGGVTSVDARETPRPHCSKHKENYEGPCKPCQKRREWDEKHESQLKAAEKARRSEIFEAVRNCPLCDDHGRIETADGLTYCGAHLRLKDAG
ncbi:hypothetical protein SEA_AUBS_76 [Mycobacterium phage Aubs]|nr:hypothetical protein SEA_AUBS_76 [Mycobacterium phage Aubs]